MAHEFGEIKSANAFPPSYFESNLVYEIPVFDAITSSWIFEFSKETLPWLAEKTKPWIEKRPTLSKHITAQYLSSMALREAHELVVAHVSSFI